MFEQFSLVFKGQNRSDLLMRTVLFSVLFFLIMSAYYAIKPIRFPVFNDYVGWNKQGLYYSLVAFVSLFLVILYNLLSSSFNRINLIRVFYGILFLCIVLFYMLFKYDMIGNTLFSITIFPGAEKEIFSWASMLYFFTATYNLFMVALFWSFNHDYHDVQESQILYPYIFLGAQIGVYFGSDIASYVGNQFENIFLFAAIMKIFIWMMFEYIHFSYVGHNKFDAISANAKSYNKKMNETLLSFGEYISYLKDPYIRKIGLMTFLMTAVASILYFQHNYYAAKTVFHDPMLYEDTEVQHLKKWLLKSDETGLQYLKEHSSFVHHDNAHTIAQMLDDYNRNDILALQHAIVTKIQSDDKYFDILDKKSLDQKNFEASLDKSNAKAFFIKAGLDENDFISPVVFTKSVSDLLHTDGLYSACKTFATEKDLVQKAPRLEKIVQLPDGVVKKFLYNKIVIEERFNRTGLFKNGQKQAYKDWSASNNKFSSLFNILFCIVITPLLLRYAGIRIGLFVLPVISVLFASFYYTSAPLWIITMAAIIYPGLNYTLYSTLKEMLYVPTTLSERYRGKAINDTFVYRAGDALTGVLETNFRAFFITGSNIIFALAYQSMSLIIVPFVIIWIISIHRVVREYLTRSEKDKV